MRYILMAKKVWECYRGRAFMARLGMSILMYFLALAILDALETQTLGGKG